MEEFLNALYEIGNQSIAPDINHIDPNISALLKEKDQLESKFADLLNREQEIPFDNYMDSIDKCNEKLNKISFRNGFLMGWNLMLSSLRISNEEKKDSIIKFIEGMQ